MFAGEVRKSSLIQSNFSYSNIFLWAAFKLYTIKYATLGEFGAFFWEYYHLGI